MIHDPPDVPSPALRFETLGDRIALLRRTKGLSKTDVAARLGVTITSICYWEQGRSRPRLARLQALATLLGTTPAELLNAEATPASDHLSNLVMRTRAEIARAAGTTPAKVRIVIEM